MTDIEVNDYLNETELSEKRDHAKYLNNEIAELENLLIDFTTKRTELKAEHKSTKLIANKIRYCKKGIKADKKYLEEILKTISKMAE